MARKISRKGIIKKLDDLIRDHLKETREKYCVVCGKSMDWFHPQNCPFGLQVSHYISRDYKALRWDLKNVEPMCIGCNYRHDKNPAPYTLYMIEKYGTERIEYLNEKRQKERASPKPIKVFELVELYEKLKKELNA